MLSTSSYPTTTSSNLNIINPHTRSSAPARRPKLTLQLPTAASPFPSAPSTSVPRTPLSPTSRNTLANSRLFSRTSSSLSIITACESDSSDSSSSESSDSECDDELQRPRRSIGGMRSVYHPITPQTGFFPVKPDAGRRRKERRVAFSDDVKVYFREFEDADY